MGAKINNQNAIKYGKKMVHAITFKMPRQDWDLFLEWAGQRCRSELIREAILNKIENEKNLEAKTRLASN